MGACRSNEMYTMTLDNLQDLGTVFLVTVPNTKTKITRKFTITEEFYPICKKYISLRPTYVTSNILFLNYQSGKCTSQRIGINKFTKMGRDIATFLQLPNPEKYSGHSFRRSSATILVDAGGDITALKRHGGWKSTAVAEGYIDNSMKNKMDTAKKITKSIQHNPFIASTSTTTTNQSINLDLNSIPTFNLSHCVNTNITINVNK